MIRDILTVLFFLGGVLGIVYLRAQRRGDVLYRPFENSSRRPRVRLGHYKFGSKQVRKQKSLRSKRDSTQLPRPDKAERELSQQLPVKTVSSDTRAQDALLNAPESTEPVAADERRAPASVVEKESVINEKGAAEIITMISMLEHITLELDQKIKAEEAKIGISDPSNIGYSMIAKVMVARRDNLNKKRAALEQELASNGLLQTEEFEKAA